MPPTTVMFLTLTPSTLSRFRKNKMLSLSLLGTHFMPLNLLLQKQKEAFTPDEVTVLVTAFEEALKELRLVNREDPAVHLVAKRIIALAQKGERDPIRLREAACKARP